MKARGRSCPLLLLGAVFLIFVCHAAAQASVEDCARSGITAAKRRALLVGIGAYNPAAGKAVGGLPFPRNDVAKIRELLESPRYGFTVCTLRDEEATRDNILKALDEYLLKGAGEGDVCLFYFSGHGSWVKNSLSDEDDRRDETLVPYDVVRPVRSRDELRDIRDKRLAESFNKAVGNKVVLTAILDSCHSGSAARQFEEEPKEVNGTGDEFDYREGPSEAQKTKPEEHGALIISASQDYQTASGGTYSVGGLEGSYSHLTAALLLALYSTPAETTPAADLFAKVTARLKADGRRQTPLIAGTPERLRQTIFGGPSSASTGRVRAAVLKEKSDGRLYLLAGLADGLTPGCELGRVDSATGKEASPPYRIKVLSAGLLKSTFEEAPVGAVARAAPSPVRDGDIFEQRTWAAFQEPSLKVWLPPATLREAELLRVAGEVGKLRDSGKVEIVEDPSEATPTHVVSFEERGRAAVWVLRHPSSEVETVGTSLSAGAVLGLLEKSNARAAKLFINLPPSAELRGQLSLGARAGRGAVEITARRDAAHYELAGRARSVAGQAAVEYAWMLTAAPMNDARTLLPNQAVQAALPATTCWVGRGGTCPAEVNSLESLALRLSKIRGWLKLTSPVAAGSPAFPYHLEVRRVGESRKTVGTLVNGQSYDLFLVADPASLKGDTVWTEFFVYVLDVDANGGSTVMYPSGAGSSGLISLGGVCAVSDDCVEGRLPREIKLTQRRSQQIVIYDETNKRRGVLGPEHFILLVTEEPISNVEALKFEGVRPRREVEGIKARRAVNPLSELLLEIGVESQSRAVTTPDNWVVDHLSFRSVAAP